MGRISRPKLAKLLRRDEQRYRALMEQGSTCMRQPNGRKLTTKEITGSQKPQKHRVHEALKKSQRVRCEIQFPTVKHAKKVYGKTLGQLGVYGDVK